MRILLLTLLIVPTLSFAQGSGELRVGEQTVAYDSVHEAEGNTLYYQGDTLVASERAGVRVLYENEVAVLEASDTDGDGELDVFVSLSSSGEVTEVTGEGAETYTRPEIVEFTDLLAAEETAPEASAEEDLVGSLESITIPGGGFPWFWILILLAAGGGGYWYWRKKGAVKPS